MAKRIKTKRGRKSSDENAAVTLPATVEKIIPPAHPADAEKAQVAVDGADDLYRELRVENTLTKESGEQVRLKEGAKVEVTIEAEPSEITKKASAKADGS